MNTVKSAWSYLTRTASDDPEESRHEFMLRVFLVSMAMIATAGTVFGALGILVGSVKLDTVLILAAMSLLFSAGWYMAGRGGWRIARFLPVALFYLAGVWGIYLGGIGTPSMLLMALAITLAAMFFSKRGQIAIIALVLASYTVLGELHRQGVIIAVRSDQSAYHNRLLIAVCALLAVGILLRFLVNQMEGAIRSSQWREQELTAVNEELRATMEELEATNEEFEATNEEFVKINRELEESEMKYRGLVESIREVIFSTDETGMLTYVSPAVRGILGFESDRFMGKNFVEFIYGEDLEKMIASFQKVASGVTDTEEYRIVGPQGRPLWVTSTSSPRMVNGRFAGINGVLADIDARRRAQQELQKKQAELLESEEYNRLLFTGSRVPIVVLDPETGGFTDCNEAAVRIYGYSSKAQVVGKTPGDVSAPVQYDGTDSSAAARERIEESRTKGSVVFPWRHRREDGAEWDAEIVLTSFRLRGRHMIQFTLTDISERLRAEKETRMNSLRFQTLFELGQMHSAPLKELADFVLERAVAITGSDIGYFAFVSGDESVLTMQSWSRKAMAECAITEKPIAYPLESTGLWGEAVRQRRPIITNDYDAPNPQKKGYPDGHVAVRRHMNIPVFEGERIVVVAGVGNKEEEYNDNDVLQLTLLMEGLWRILRIRQSEEALRDSEERFRSMIQSSSDMIFVLDESGSFTYESPSVERILGYPAGYFIGRTPFELIHPDDMNIVKKEMDDVYRSVNSGIPTEFRLQCSDGTWIPLEALASNLMENSAVRGIVITARDVTERKRALKAMQDSEARFRTLAESSPVPIAMARNGMVFFVNRAFLDISRYESSEEAIGISLLDFVAPEERERIAGYMRDRRDRANVPVYYESVGVRRDGSRFPYEITVAIVEMADGPVTVAFIRDITERRMAEGAIREREATLRSLLNASPAGVVMVANRVFRQVNSRFCAISGYNEEELVGQSSRMIYPGEEEFLRVGRELYGEMERSGLGMLEARLRRKDGIEVDVLIGAAPFDPADPSAGACVTLLDITAHKQAVSQREAAREALREKEAIMRGLLEATPAGVGMVRDRRFVQVNASLCRMTGYTEEELVGQPSRIIYRSDEDFEHSGRWLYGEMERTGLGTMEVQMRRKDGSFFDAMLSLAPFDPADPSAGVCATALDITERKRAEESLRERERVLQSIFDASPAGIALVVDRRFRQVNSSFCRITGYPEEEMVGQHSRMLYPSDEEYDRVGRNLYGDMLRTGQGMMEVQMRRKDGADIDVLLGLAPFDPADPPEGACVTALDITERKMAEGALKVREGALRSILEASPVGIALLVDRRFRQVNRSLCRITGYAEEDMLGRYTRMLYPDDEEYRKVGSELYREMQERGVGIMEVRLRHKEGNIYFVILGLAPFDPADLSAGVCATVMDITERKRAEETIRTMNLDLEKKVQDRTEELRRAYDNLVKTNSELETALRNLSETQQQLVLSEKLAALGQLAAGMAHELNTPLGAIMSSNRTMIDIITTGLPALADLMVGLKKGDKERFDALLLESLAAAVDIDRTVDRKTKRDIRLRLEQAGAEDNRALSDAIADLGLYRYVRKHPAILKNEQLGGFLKGISSLASLRRLGEIVAIAAEKASHVVGALRSYLRQEEQGELTPVDLKSELDVILTLYYNKLKYGVTVKKGYEEGGYVLGNRNGLNQVWMNLLNNALQAMDYRGTLEILTRPQGEWIVVSVIDSGSGIPEEIRGRIFEPFFTTKQYGEGIGLGLDISRKIVESLGGRIEVESVPGRTEFRVWLKAAAPS
ncbi:MAG: PAS domain S-box protein [Spirochaetes bacterium]|nr:PAS domain S-box protein [Spirochaetota bacterium]